MRRLAHVALALASGVVAATACSVNSDTRDTSRAADTSIVFQPSTKVGGPPRSGDTSGSPDSAGRLFRPITAEDSFPTTLPDASVDAPRLTRIGRRTVLLLPPRMIAALRSAMPSFRTFRRADYSPEMPDTVYGDPTKQAHFAVIGDFDGDHRLDVALYGRADSAVVLLAALDEAAGTRVVEVQRESVDQRSPAPGVLTYEAPGHRDYGDDRLQLANAAFSVVAEYGSTLYYYENGKFQQIVAGD